MKVINEENEMQIFYLHKNQFCFCHYLNQPTHKNLHQFQHMEGGEFLHLSNNMYIKYKNLLISQEVIMQKLIINK